MTRKLTRVKQALIRLRSELEFSQRGLADELNVTQVSVARWETGREPRGLHLFLLGKLARSSGENSLAEIFENALREEFPRLRIWETAHAAA